MATPEQRATDSGQMTTRLTTRVPDDLEQDLEAALADENFEDCQSELIRNALRNYLSRPFSADQPDTGGSE
jgi:Arc/MetJ-type ribon-helix-helix transcriptional regulator